MIGFLTALFSGGGTALAGGLFGLIGSLFGQWMKYRQTQADYAFKKDEWAHELDLQKLQLQAKKEETEQEVILANTQGTWSGLTASIQADAQNKASYLWVAAVKDLTRPIITAVFSIVLCVTFFVSTDLAMKGTIIESIIFISTTSISWWFGDRGPNMDNKNNTVKKKAADAK